MAALLSVLPASIAGGALLAVRTRRHFQHLPATSFASWLSLPIDATSDVALTIVTYVATVLVLKGLARRAGQSSRRWSADIEASPLLGRHSIEEKLLNEEERQAVKEEKRSYWASATAKPQSIEQRTISPLYLTSLVVLFLLFGAAFTLWLTGVSIMMFENDSSGMPFDFVHFFEMRENIREGMRWIPVTASQVTWAVVPILVCGFLVAVATLSVKDVPARLRFLVFILYTLLGISASFFRPDAFTGENILVEAAKGYRSYVRAKALVLESTSELPGDRSFYGESNMRAPLVSSWSRANATAPRHIFHILVESASAKAFPFDPSFCDVHGCTDVDPSYLTPEYLTPNYLRLVSQGYDAGALMSTTSFSNKAHFSAMAGTMQEVKDWTSEFKRPTALPGLPELLKSLDPSFRTAAFASGDAYWDKLNRSLGKLGYDHIASKPEIIERGLPCTELAELMCADDEILPLVEEWIDAQLADNARMFMSLVTINLHMEYYSPGKHLKYSKSPKANAFLNSLRWTDHALGLFLDVLEKRGLLENSLVFLHGDHADHLSRRPDGYTELGPHEDIYVVPFAMRMPGGSVVGKMPKPERLPYGLDIVPTILDALEVAPSLIEHYNGRSMLREQPVGDDRLMFTVESPGKTAIMLHDGSFKLALLSSGGGYFCAIDRAIDPLQEKPLCFNQANGKRRIVLANMEPEVQQRLEDWIDNKAMAAFEEHLAVNSRYWSDAAVEGHEKSHAAFLELARGALVGSGQ